MDEDKTVQTQEEAKQGSEASFVDMLTDGDSHSPEAAEGTPDFGEQTTPQAQEPPAKADSGNGEEIERLRSQLERANKRLHDTQSRLHEECARRAELQKELSDFQDREDNSDDWFSSEDTTRKEELQKQIAESDERLRQLGEEDVSSQTDDAREEWLAQAEALAKSHPDFAKKVYTDLGGLLDPQGKDFNPAVRQAWDATQDKSPEGAYRFAVEMLDRLEAFNDPTAYREKVRQEVLQGLGNDKPFGSEGLDLFNSANGGTPVQSEPDGFVEALFK